VRLDRTNRQITIECWPRWIDPSQPDAAQYPGWPVICHQLDNYSREPAGFLPRIVVDGLDNPVVQVIAERTGEILYTIRIAGRDIQPRVFSLDETYTLIVGDPDLGVEQRFTGLEATGSRTGSPARMISF
jgi:hypothetical protein